VGKRRLVCFVLLDVVGAEMGLVSHVEFFATSTVSKANMTRCGCVFQAICGGKVGTYRYECAWKEGHGYDGEGLHCRAVTLAGHCDCSRISSDFNI
jgi:hypothetical protein